MQSLACPPCPFPRSCKPKSSLCAQDGDCCQGAGALFCRPVAPGGAPKCVSRPNKPTIQAVSRVLADSGALSAFSLRLRQPESGIYGASIELYEVTATSADGAATLVVNSTVVSPCCRPAHTFPLRLLYANGLADRLHAQAARWYVRAAQPSRPRPPKCRWLTAVPHPLPRPPALQNTPISMAEQEPPVLCGRRWSFTARALSTTGLWSEPAVYGWNPASALPCPCNARDAACSDDCCAGLQCVAALPGGPRACAAQPAAPAITAAEPVAAADGTLASIAVQLQPGGDAGAANAALSVLELRATAEGAEPMELRVPAVRCRCVGCCCRSPDVPAAGCAAGAAACRSPMCLLVLRCSCCSLPQPAAALPPPAAGATAAECPPPSRAWLQEPASRLPEPSTRLSLAGSGGQLCGRQWTITARVLSTSGLWSAPAEFTFVAPPCCEPHGASPVGGDATRCAQSAAPACSLVLLVAAQRLCHSPGGSGPRPLLPHCTLFLLQVLLRIRRSLHRHLRPATVSRAAPAQLALGAATRWACNRAATQRRLGDWRRRPARPSPAPCAQLQGVLPDGRPQQQRR